MSSSESIINALKLNFKHKSFRSKEQENAIKCVINGKNDIFVSMPTGSGKSLIYQLPGSMANKKVTIVVSPLIALIKDQMEHLNKLKIKADSINSKMSEKDRKSVKLDLDSKAPSIKFVFITPEQSQTASFQAILGKLCRLIATLSDLILVC